MPSLPIRSRAGGTSHGRLLTAAQVVYASPITAEVEIITLDKWFEPFADPVRVRPALRAAAQQFQLQTLTPPIVSFSYYTWLTEPVRFKKGLEIRYRQFFTADTKPIVSFGYYGWLTEPVRFKKGLRADEQQAFVGPPAYPNLPTTIPWFAPLTEPVRHKKGLWARLQQFFAIDTKPIAAGVSITIDATETNNDTAFFSASVYNRPVRAYVSIKEVPTNNDAIASIEET
jgi:hypothetical protein